ncbi:MAG: tetratricopeptide repeat protein [Rhodomicrobium sp.]
MKTLTKTLKAVTSAVIVSLSVAGCKELENYGLAEPDPKGEMTADSTFGGGPEQVWVNKAKENFRHGEYGLAERYFRQAIEERHSNAEAWLGLAASYDHLKRFEEADRAYEVLKKMTGDTPTVLNNLGFHYMLKGEFVSAEHALHAAQEQDPNNPLIQANLALLSDWKAAAGKQG